MCQQAYELLTYKGRTRGIHARPLKQYFELMEMENPFHSFHTSNHRGYTGSWEIFNDKLYLIHLRGRNKKHIHLKIKDLFPNQNQVMAAWFTGYIYTWENHNPDQKGNKIWRFHELYFQLGRLVEDNMIKPPPKKVIFKNKVHHRASYKDESID